MSSEDNENYSNVMKEVFNEFNETLGYTHFDPTDIEKAGKELTNLIPFLEGLILKRADAGATK